MASASRVLVLIVSFLFWLLVQRLMDGGHGNRSFADSRRHALEISAPDVADREDARQARLEKMRRPRERPPGRGQVVARKIRPCLDEPVCVERDAAFEPMRV